MVKNPGGVVRVRDFNRGGRWFEAGRPGLFEKVSAVRRSLRLVKLSTQSNVKKLNRAGLLICFPRAFRVFLVRIPALLYRMFACNLFPSPCGG